MCSIFTLWKYSQKPVLHIDLEQVSLHLLGQRLNCTQFMGSQRVGHDWETELNWLSPSHPPLPLLVTTRLSPTSVSLFLLCKSVHQHHFSSVHMHAPIHNVCFSLSDLLHSASQSLSPSRSLQMAQFPSFLAWVIFHCIYVLRILCPFLCWLTLRLFPCPGYCK